MAVVIMSGPMAESMTASGRIITCTVKVSIPGKMVVNTTENISMIANTDMVSIPGKMAANTKVIGTMENNMDKEYINNQTVRPKKVSGRKVNASAGKMKNLTAKPLVNLPTGSRSKNETSDNTLYETEKLVKRDGH